MADPNPNVQRTGYQMLNGAISKDELLEMQRIVQDVRNEIAIIRADVIPIDKEDLMTNAAFFGLNEKFNLFKQKYGFTVEQLEFEKNASFSDLESRMDLAENRLKTVESRLNTLSSDFDASLVRIRAIETKLGITAP